MSLQDEFQNILQKYRSGQLAEAKNYGLRLKEAYPNIDGVIHLLANIEQDLNEWEASQSSYLEAIRLSPQNSDYHNSYGTLLRLMGSLSEAKNEYERAIQLKPDYYLPYQNLGNLLKAQGDFDRASEFFLKAIELNPRAHEAYNNLGVLLLDQGKIKEAEQSFRKSLEIEPRFTMASLNLAQSLGLQEKVSEEKEIYEKLLKENPNLYQAWNNLGSALCRQSFVPEAIKAYENALVFGQSEPEIWSNYLLSLNYQNEENVSLREAHRKWGEAVSHPSFFFEKWESSHRRLKIGYVSADMRTHSITHFFEPLLEHHDPQHFEIFIYTDVIQFDETTQRLKLKAHHWNSIVGWSSEQVAQKIYEDKIDILVDLSGHSSKNRLMVFALKPAPVQITYLGYPNTTGLTTMDYRLTDEDADPEGSEVGYTEKLIRLPHGFLTYLPPLNSPEIKPVPRIKNGFVTFGSFNNLAKISLHTIRLWSRVLKSVEGSKLLLKSKTLSDRQTQEHFIQAFGQEGIASDRLILKGWMEDRESHLSLYSLIDVALDPYPYHGTTTTCEALWMGVPVVTLAGHVHASRVGVSLLKHVGHPEWIAHSEDEYVKIVMEICNGKGAASSAPTRDDLKKTDLFNAKKITHSIEDVYRHVGALLAAPGN